MQTLDKEMDQYEEVIYLPSDDDNSRYDRYFNSTALIYNQF